MKIYFIFVYLSQPYLLVRILEEVGIKGKEDSENRAFPMVILRGGHTKVPIIKASGKF